MFHILQPLIIYWCQEKSYNDVHDGHHWLCMCILFLCLHIRKPPWMTSFCKWPQVKVLNFFLLYSQTCLSENSQKTFTGQPINLKLLNILLIHLLQVSPQDGQNTLFNWILKGVSITLYLEKPFTLPHNKPCQDIEYTCGANRRHLAN